MVAVEAVEAAARTWQRPHAQDHLMDIAPLPAKGEARAKARGGFNFSLDDKRVLNAVSVVTDADKKAAAMETVAPMRVSPAMLPVNFLEIQRAPNTRPIN